MAGPHLKAPDTSLQWRNTSTFPRRALHLWPIKCRLLSEGRLHNFRSHRHGLEQLSTKPSLLSHGAGTIFRLFTLGTIRPDSFLHTSDAEEGSIRGLPAITVPTDECGGFRLISGTLTLVETYTAIAILVEISIRSSDFQRKARRVWPSFGVGSPNNALWLVHSFSPT